MAQSIVPTVMIISKGNTFQREKASSTGLNVDNYASDLGDISDKDIGPFDSDQESDADDPEAIIRSNEDGSDGDDPPAEGELDSDSEDDETHSIASSNGVWQPIKGEDIATPPPLFTATPGLKHPPLQDAQSIYYLKLFINVTLLDHIVRETNRYNDQFVNSNHDYLAAQNILQCTSGSSKVTQHRSSLEPSSELS